jgi:hypothetical protein
VLCALGGVAEDGLGRVGARSPAREDGVIDDPVGVEQVEVVEVELAAGREDEDGRDVSVIPHGLDHVARDVEGRVREEVDDRDARVAMAEQVEVGGELGEHARGVSASLALEREQEGGGELAVAGAVELVEARVEEAEGDVFALEKELLAGGDGHPAGEGLALAAHGGRGVDEQVVDSLLLVAALLAGVVEDLVVGEAAGELEVVPGELGQDHAVDGSAGAEAGVAEGGAGAGGGAGLGLKDAGEDLEREVHDVVGLGRLEGGEEVDLGESARGGLGSKDAEEAEGVDVEGVSHREDEEARGLEGLQGADLVVAAGGREEAGELGIDGLEEAGVHGDNGSVGGLRGDSGGDGAEDAGEDDDEEVVAHLELGGAAGDVAVTELGEEGAVDLEEARGVAGRGHEGGRVAAGAELELLARGAEEHADVVDEAEGEDDAEAL